MTSLGVRPVTHLSRYWSLIDRQKALKAKANKRPETKRWSSAPAAPQSRKLLDVPDAVTAQAYKVRYVQSSRDYLMHVSETMREDLLLIFIRAFAHYGASLDVLEEVALHASRAFDVRVAVVRKTGTLTCFVGERVGGRRYVCAVSPLLRRFVDGGLSEVQRMYNAVVEQRVRVPEASRRVEHMCTKPAMRYPIVHVCIAAVLAGATCLFLFGGLTWDIFCSIVGSFVLGCVHLIVRRASPLLAEVVEACASLYLTVVTHDSRTSPALTSILPGYLYLCCILKHKAKYTRLELFVALFASIYTAALAYGLPTIFDLFLMSQLFSLVITVKKAWELIPSRRLTKSIL